MPPHASQPRILIADNDHTHNGRQMLRGFHAIAGERNWLVLRVEQSQAVRAALTQWEVDAVVLGATPAERLPDSVWAGLPVVGMNVNSSVRPIASVHPDDGAVGAAAASHLLAKGFRSFSTFTIGTWPWALDRAAGFRRAIQAAGAAMAPEGLFRMQPDPVHEFGDWLRSLPKGTAILAGCDAWGALLLLACRIAGITVPDELAVMGVDDDELVCETSQPHLSSVRIPWQEVGRATATMLEGMLRHGSNRGKVVRISPAGIVERRSTHFAAVEHPVVAQALRYLRAHAHQPLEVDEVVAHVITNRRWLERAFRKHLGRSILQEIHRAQLDRARHLLATSPLPMPAVARGAGFGGSVARFSRMFHEQEGMTPSEYRRRFALRM